MRRIACRPPRMVGMVSGEDGELHCAVRGLGVAAVPGERALVLEAEASFEWARASVRAQEGSDQESGRHQYGDRRREDEKCVLGRHDCLPFRLAPAGSGYAAAASVSVGG
ncbi:hypothetical protein ACH4TP_06965 [Streptomyces sp. NPDC021012]|uniref:hypothetical protein n=1 Tax=Streptomyces sp. NPDC021012 TaxID=3365107 RepID=UPI0037957A34